MANSVDPDQTAPLFAQTYLSENLGTLRYHKHKVKVIYLLRI